MAEAFAVAASLAAILQLASYGIKVGRALEGFAKRSGLVRGEIDMFTIQARSFTDTVILAQMTLQRHCDEHEQSPVLVYISQHRVLDSIEKLTKIVRRHLKSAKLKVESMETKFRMMAALRWTMNRESILQLFPEMESVKTSLNLIISTVHLELATIALKEARERGAADDRAEVTKRLEDQIRDLKRTVREQVRTINRLSTQIERRYSRQELFAPEFIFASHQSQDALVELGRSMAENSILSNIQSSESSVNGNPPISEQENNSRSVSDDSAHRPDTDSDQDVPSASTTATTTWSEVPSRTGLATRRPRPLTSLSPTSSASNESRGFTIMRPANSILRFNPHQMYPITRGYINQHGRAQLASARFDETLNGNIISVTSAKQYDIDVQELEHPQNGVMIDTGSSVPQRSIGKATFTWRDMQHDRSQWAVRVHCDVCRDNQPLLVLGKPFADNYTKRQHNGAEGESKEQ